MKRYCLQGLCSTPEDHWSPQGGPERTEPYIMTVHRKSHSIAALASMLGETGDGSSQKYGAMDTMHRSMSISMSPKVSDCFVQFVHGIVI